MSDNNAVVVSEQVVLNSKNIEVVPYGLKFKNELSREEFVTAFQTLNRVNSVYQWYLGDLIAQADWQYKGEMYDMMMDATGLERKTLQNLASVSRTYSADIRELVMNQLPVNGKMSIEHFKEVAHLMNSNPDHAVDFLIRAGKQGWTIAILREEIAKWKNGGRLPEKAEPDEEMNAFKGSTKVYFPNLVRHMPLRQYNHEEDYLDALEVAIVARRAELENGE